MPSGKKHKILVICPHPEDMAPGQRLKYEQYFGYFRQNGFEVDVKPFMSVRFQNIVYKKGYVVEKIFWTLTGYVKRFFQLFTLRRYDVIYIFLWVTPFGPPCFEWLYKKISRKIIYDIDDLVYLPASTSKVNGFIARMKGNNKPIYMMKAADHVITCTPYLDNFVKRYNTNTTDISSTINTDEYRPKEDYSIEGRKVTLGWSGSHSTSKYLHLLEPVFYSLKNDNIPFKLLVMGDPDFFIEGVETEALPWKKSYEIEVINRFDIGLYPLPDEEWVYGKSGLKALQYMAAGIPTVATAIGTNFRIIKNGQTGFIASSHEEWLSYLKQLINSQDLRKKIGRAGAELVEESFSINANRDTYLNILRKVIKETVN
jgi:glycosyltransferase involved in cell wall biosynthesis